MIEGSSGDFFDPELLSKVERFSERLKVEVGHLLSDPISIIHVLKKANQALHGGRESYYKVPETQAEIEQLYFLLSGDKYFKEFIKDDYSSVRLHTRVKAIGSKVGKRIKIENEPILRGYFPPPFKANFTGANVVWVNMENYIVRTLVKSFSATMLIVTLLMCIQLKSFRWGLLSIIPNLFPIIVTFGIMGWVGISLNMITMMIASIAIGIAVDDTIHVMTHLRQKMTEGVKINDAIYETLQKTGIAVISTSLLLALGFFSLCTNSFVPTVQFGFLTGLTIIAALYGDLVLLPSIMKLFYSRRKS